MMTASRPGTKHGPRGAGQKSTANGSKTGAVPSFSRSLPPFKSDFEADLMSTKRHPQPPAHLTPATREWWKSVVEDYELEPHHLRLLQLAGEAWDRSQQARQVLTVEGLTYQNRFGDPVLRPKRHANGTPASKPMRPAPRPLRRPAPDWGCRLSPSRLTGSSMAGSPAPIWRATPPTLSAPTARAKRRRS